MAQKVVFTLFFFLLLSSIYPNVQDTRVGREMLRVQAFRKAGNWPGIIRSAYRLLEWGERTHAEKCLEIARLLIIARKSEGGALQMAFLYQKLHKPKLERYWKEVLALFSRMKKNSWKKTRSRIES